MTNEPNVGRVDHCAALLPAEAASPVREACLHGAIAGQIAAGRFVLQVGEPCGVLIGQAAGSEQAQVRPRPTPILLSPRVIRRLFGRSTELVEIFRALDTGVPIELSGEPGIGKTAILRHLAHHPHTASFDDGVVYLSARHRSSADLLQLIFEAFYESDEIRKPTETETRRGLRGKRALILLDDVRLPPHELDQLLDIAPQSAFVVAARERCSVREVRSVALKGLPPEDGVSLLEHEIERPLDDSEQSAAATLCAALGGHPLRILQAAAIVREQGISLDACARTITPRRLMAELMAPIDEKQRRALLALSALAGVPLSVQHVSGIAEVTDIEPSLMMLARRGVVVSSQSRFVSATGVADYLRRTEDLNPWVNRAVTYFTAWAERYRRDPVVLLEESEALLRIQQNAADNRRWGEVLRTGSIIEGALVVGSRWGAWAIDLERCLDAARAMGDRSAEGWALHEIGTRHLCVGQPDAARALLTQALKVREATGDTRAAAASRRNLEFVPAPVAVAPRARTTVAVRDSGFEVGSLELRDVRELTLLSPDTKRVNAVPLMVLAIAILGALVYWVEAARPSWTSLNAAAIGSLLQGGIGAVRDVPTTAPQPSQANLRVLQFSSSSDRIAPGEPVRLCYEVANGVRVRIDPGIGEVLALPRDCVSAMPADTTTYLLTAYGAGGDNERQTARVVVTVAESPMSDALLASSAAPAEDADRASIRIFSPRPGSIVTNAPTRLCYALRDAVDARVEPGIGKVIPASTLTCLRVSPVRTTTYQLIAHGRDGYPVRQQLVIVVR